MDIQLLKAFIALSEELHFGKAAAAMHCSQPTLSQQIARLESATSTTLFERSTRSVRLTAAGEQLLPLARTAVEASESFAAQARGIAHALTGRVRIGYSGYGPSRYLPQVLALISAAHPGVSVELIPHLFAGRAFAALQNREVDFAIFRPENLAPDFLTLPIAEDRVYAVMPADHRLATKSDIAVKDLAGERLISYPTSTVGSVRAEFERLARAAGVSFTVAHEVTDTVMAIAMAEAGLGVTYCWDSSADICSDAVMLVPIRDVLMPPVSLVWRAKKHNDRLQAAIIDGFENYLSSPPTNR